MNYRFWPPQKKFIQTLGHCSPLTPFPQFGHFSPPIWPFLPDHIFICISDGAVQSYFSSPISIEFAGRTKVQKLISLNSCLGDGKRICCNIGCKMLCGNSLVLVESRGNDGWQSILRPSILDEASKDALSPSIYFKFKFKETIMKLRFLLLRNHLQRTKGSDVWSWGCWRSLAPAEAGKDDGHLHAVAADTPSPPPQSA